MKRKTSLHFKRAIFSLLMLFGIVLGSSAQDMTSTPLTFEVVEDGTIMVAWDEYSTPTLDVIQYKLNDGEWTDAAWNTPINVTANDVISFQGDNGSCYDESTWAGFHLECSNNCYVYGNVMSLIDKDGFATNTTLTKTYAFYHLFQKHDWTENTTILNHATKNIVLSATTLTDNCYDGMFQDCKGITRAPELPAMSLAEWCYCAMFMNCSNLQTAPALPATTLVNACYPDMFMNCTSLTIAPDLPAATLAEGCYSNMFVNCSNLNYVKCLATDLSAQNCTNNWLGGVAATGTFVKAASMGSWPVGPDGDDNVNGIPAGWTVENNSGFDPYNTPLTFEATTNGNISFTLKLGYGTDPSVMNAIEYKKNDGAWTTYTWGDAISVVATDKVAFRGNNAQYYGNSSPSYNSYITSTADVYVYGNVMSLINSTSFASLTTLTGDWNFAYLFAQPRSFSDPVVDVTTMKSHPTNDLVLPATTLTNYCYFGMFEGCKGITRAPELPATTMKNGCYAEMFRSSGLVTAPELPCTVMDPYYFDGAGEHGSIDCYMQMFQDCTSLTTAPALPATKLVHGVYQFMFQGCTNLTTVPTLPATKVAEQAYCNMFEGCTSLNYVKCFATDISENWAVEDWLKGVPATGTFVKSAAMTSWPDGDSGIPTGWTVQNTTAADGDMSITPLTLEAVEAGTIIIKNANGLSLEYTSSVSGAHVSTDNPVSIAVVAGETIALQCSNTAKGINFGISSTNPIYVYGNPMSLVFGSSFSGQTDLSACDYGILMALFHPAMDGATLYPNTLCHPTKDIVLPATTLSAGCYAWMFSGCTNLTRAPELPAATLGEDCYHRMFEHCMSLTTAPVLPAAHVVGQSYGGLFDGCTSLNYVKCLATSFDNKQDLGDWLNGVSATGVFVKGGIVDYPRGGSGIPTGWTVDREWGVGDTETLTANADGEGNYWTTYYNGLTSVTADANTTVYKAKVSDDKTEVVLTNIGSKDIPAGNAVVMKSTAAIVTLEVGYASIPLSDNDLLGQSASFNTPDNLYALLKGTNGVGFYHYPTTMYWYGSTISTTFPAQKAYLIVASSSRSFLGIGGIPTNDETAINTTETTTTDDAPLYDLTGRKAGGRPAPGIYVRNGKKIIIK